MGIMLGNLSVEDIEYRLSITLSDEDRKQLNDSRQQKAEKIEQGKWHCFDLPFMIVCGDKETAVKFNKLFSAYDLSHARQCCQLTWETPTIIEAEENEDAD